MPAVNVASVVTLLLLLLGVASAQKETGDGIPYKENNGCMGRYLAATRYGNTYYLVPLSQAVQCYQNMTIAKDMALQTVNSYGKLFDLAYTFYDIATDAPDSNPLINTMNWEIYSGSEQGQVNFAASFDGLAEKVKADGRADGLLPYKIVDIVNQARDPHTSNLNNMFNGLNKDTLWLINLNAIRDPLPPNMTRWLTFSDNEDDGVSVLIRYQDVKNNFDITNSVVETINGEDAFSFLQSFASNTGLDDACTYKSYGVRLNSLALANSVVDPALVMKFDFGSFGDISKLPACMEVTFADGKQEEWCLFLAFASADEVMLTVEEWNAKANQIPDEGPYKAFEAILNAVNGDGDGILTVEDSSQKRRSLKALLPTETPDKSEGNLMGFTWFYSDSSDYNEQSTLLGGYTVKNDTLIFRYPGFEDTDDTIAMWKKIVDVAKKEKTTKLLIDMIGNGGGYINTAYFLTLALYPEMTFNDCVNQYNFRVSENMNAVLSVSQTFTDTLNMLDSKLPELVPYLNSNPVVASKSLKTVSNIFKALELVWKRIEASKILDDKEWKQLLSAASALEEVSARLLKNQQVSDDDLIAALKEITLLDLYQDVFTHRTRNNTALREVIQGGRQVNVTEFYTFLNAALYEKFQESIVPDLPFESYILLSEGLSGSSASIFENNVRAFAKKNAGKVTPAVGVSFGCAGVKESCPISQFAGGSIRNSRTFLGDAYVEAGLYLAVYSLILPFIDDASLPGHQAFVDFKTRVDDLLLALPQPPMGAAQFPEYAVEMYYSTLMSPDTLPVEYFNIPPDAYIKFWPKPDSIMRGDNTFSQDSLPYLYEKASEFFVTKGDVVTQEDTIGQEDNVRQEDTIGQEEFIGQEDGIQAPEEVPGDSSQVPSLVFAMIWSFMLIALQ